jgi:hypothetical protein
MEPDEQKIFHDNVNVEEDVELMRGQSVSSELVKSIYDQLSTDAEKLMKERFHYYAIENDENLLFYCVDHWTSRYLISYDTHSTNFDSYNIKIIDLFNDKSM